MFNPNQVEPKWPNNALEKIYKSIRPVYLVGKVTGLNYIRLKNGNIQKSDKIDRIYASGFIILYTSLTFYTIWNIFNGENAGLANKYFVLFESFVLTSLMVIIVTFTFISRHLVSKSLVLLSQIDETFTENSYQLDYPKLLKTNYVTIALISTSLVVKCSLMFLAINFDCLQQITMVFASTVKTMTRYQFISLVLQMQMRFIDINNAIMAFYMHPTSKLILDPGSGAIPQKLYLLCRLHYKLANVSRKLNAAFAFQLLVSIGASLCDILFQAYCLYYVLVGNVPSVTFSLIACPVVWLFDEMLGIYLLVQACADTCDHVRNIIIEICLIFFILKANDTPSILHELRNKYFNVELDTDVRSVIFLDIMCIIFF